MPITEESYGSYENFDIWRLEPTIDEDSLLEKLKSLRNHSITKFNAAVTYVTKAAAVDTGAIEKLYDTDRGFTYAVAAQVNAIDFVQNRKGDSFASHFADQLNAYEYILDHATGAKPLTQAAIRELHAILCAHQETYRIWTGENWEERALEKGAYKNQPNTVTKSDGNKHFYCPPEQVASEIQRLTDQAATPEFLKAPGIVKAAYIHHVLTVVHPFSDGNGRVSRALASIYLLSDYGIPLLVHADQRDFYFDALESADTGNTEEFCYFIYDRAWEALELIEENINKKVDRDSEKVIAKVIHKYANESEGYDAKTDSIGRKLSRAGIDALKNEAELVAAKLGDYIEISAGQITSQTDKAKPRIGFREVYGQTAKLYITIKTKNPSDTSSIQYIFDILVPASNTVDRRIFLIQTAPPPEKEAIYARFSECENGLKKSLEYRIKNWAEKTVKEIVYNFAQ